MLLKSILKAYFYVIISIFECAFIKAERSGEFMLNEYLTITECLITTKTIYHKISYSRKKNGYV